MKAWLFLSFILGVKVYAATLQHVSRLWWRGIQRIWRTLLVLTGGAWGLLWFAWARPALAGTCEAVIPDFSACLDAKEYSMYQFVAIGGWMLDRALLQGAYLVNRARWFLVDTVFLGGYNAMHQAVGPLVMPLISLALTAALLSIIAIPILGRNVFGNLRQIALLAMFLPWALTNLGPAVVQLELMRSDLVTATFADLQATMPASMFGGKDGTADIANVRSLYPTRCGSILLQRGGGDGLRIADSVAALLWAGGKDIHCPTLNATNDQPLLPDDWTKPEKADFAYGGNLGDVDDAQIRQKYITRIQQGATRAWLAIPSGMLANLDELMQMVFGFAMMVLWIGAPVVLVASLFQTTFAGLVVLIRGTIEVIQVSLLTSFLVQIVTLFLNATAQNGSALGYIAFSIMSGVLLVFLVCVACVTVWRAMKVVGESFVVSIGGAAITMQQTAGMTAGVAGAATGAALGVGAAALGVGAMALARGANGSYALGEALGSSAPLSRLGGLASMMGLLSPEAEQGLATASRYDAVSIAGVRARRSDQTRYAATGSSVAHQDRREARDYAREAAQVEDAQTAFAYRERLTPQDYQAQNRDLRERRLAYQYQQERTPLDYVQQQMRREDMQQAFWTQQAAMPEKRDMEAAQQVARRAASYAQQVARDPASTPAQREEATVAAQTAQDIAREKVRAYEDAHMRATPGETQRVRRAAAEVEVTINARQAGGQDTTVTEVTPSATNPPRITTQPYELPGRGPDHPPTLSTGRPTPQLPPSGGAREVIEVTVSIPPHTPPQRGHVQLPVEAAASPDTPLPRIVPVVLTPPAEGEEEKMSHA